MKSEVTINRKFGAPFELGLHEDIAMDSRARLACAFLERWGMVTAKDDGEDSVGRQKLGAMPVPEVVTRAFDCAEQAYAEAERRGWTLQVPSFSECSEIVRRKDKEPA